MHKKEGKTSKTQINKIRKWHRKVNVYKKNFSEKIFFFRTRVLLNILYKILVTNELSKVAIN